ncbi:MAG: hypothetical protein K8R18_07965 [Parvibaculum sp.]|uniref:hypothetical protein n=1 Tax=Parvibaculum sp. TaxID=2024848 RepID=UPI0025EE365D|nr:hypothetical protein [Parvibaculum sp.]MCE9649544.1 hypothetical protein [Parvibaculum sp.]
MNRFGLVALLGVVVFVITTWLAVISPKQVAHPVEGDQRDPILAFEMVRTPADLTAVIGEDRADYAELRDAIDKVNRIDFLYMTVYGAFIAAFFATIASARGDRRWLILSALGIVALLADVRENMALLAMTQDGADVAGLIDTMFVSTWIKWFALGIAAAGAGLALFEDRTMPVLRLIGVIVGVAALGFTVASYIDPVRFPQYMALAIFVTWLLQVIYAYRVSRAPAV